MLWHKASATGPDHIIVSTAGSAIIALTRRCSTIWTRSFHIRLCRHPGIWPFARYRGRFHHRGSRAGRDRDRGPPGLGRLPRHRSFDGRQGGAESRHRWRPGSSRRSPSRQCPPLRCQSMLTRSISSPAPATGRHRTRLIGARSAADCRTTWMERLLKTRARHRAARRFRSYMRSFIRDDLSAGSAAVTSPMLVLAGEHDEACARNRRAVFPQLFPHAIVEALANSATTRCRRRRCSLRPGWSFPGRGERPRLRGGARSSSC